MGGKPLDDSKGWERGNSGEQRYKCVVAVSNDNVAIIFPKANVIGRGASTDGAVGLAISSHSFEGFDYHCIRISV